MFETVSLLCPKSKVKFEKSSLLRRTVTHRVELIEKYIASKYGKKAVPLKFCSIALDALIDLKNTNQLIIFIQGIGDSVEFTEKLITMGSLKGKTSGF